MRVRSNMQLPLLQSERFQLFVSIYLFPPSYNNPPYQSQAVLKAAYNTYLIKYNPQ